MSSRLADHEVIPNNEMNEEGDFVHFALSDKVWKIAMIEVLDAISRNNTWELTK